MEKKLLHKLYTKIKNNFPFFAHNILKIRSKNHCLESFILNKEQVYINKLIQQQIKNNNKVKILILKGRQVGITTLLAAYNYYWCLTNIGVKSLVLSHKQASTNNIYSIIYRFFYNSPFFLSP